jgi:H+/Cl- antiporter ClcA
MKIINREIFIHHWSLMSSLSFFLINLINSYLPLFLSQIIYKTTDIDFPSTGNIFTGNVIGGEMDLFTKILIGAFMGIAMGIVSGLALGLFPSFSILNKEIKKEWILRVIISMCTSYVVNSIFYTVSYDKNLLGGHLSNLYTYGLLFTGFIYGVFTRNVFKKLISRELMPF